MKKLFITLCSKTRIAIFSTIVFFSIAAPNVIAFEFGGFGDISVLDNNAENERLHFELGRLDLYALKRFEKISTFTEFLLEFDETGSTAVDLERLWVKYEFSEQLSISGGRFHTILGNWNRSFHHGAHLYNSVSRPAFLDFEDDSGVMPSHQIGLLFDGKLRVPSVELTYSFMMGNGSKVKGTADDARLLDANNVTDNNDNKSYSGRLVVSPTAVEGLNIGFGGIFSTVSAEDNTADAVAQSIWIFDVAFAAGPVDLIAEYFHMINRADRSYFNNFFYLQGAYNATDDIVPYYRYEKQVVREGDPYIMSFNSSENSTTGLVDVEGGPIQDYEKNIVGIRYFISFASSVKVEARFLSKRHNLSSVEYAAQWTYSF